MPYTSSATEAMKSMQKQYGSNWKRVYYGLANKRAGKGLKGAHRGHKAANTAYAKGSHWKGRKRKATTRRRSNTRSRVSRRGAGRANVRAR